MGKKDDDLNQYERSYEGCHGQRVHSNDLDLFLEDIFALNALADEKDSLDISRFAACIWGHPGIGKTAKVKQFASKPVKWGGKEYEGYKVYDVPIGQFEEMGDLHGMPERHASMYKGEGKAREENCQKESDL